ncbi:MAG: exo-alpha-sialidase [Anaerolineae bacterium]|nr:exo-alpha-sialidase [Anaerolineae bacterium]
MSKQAKWTVGWLLALTLALIVARSGLVLAAGPGADIRLTNDYPGGGYVSAYTLATGQPYTDAVLDECSQARGRQNEPSVAVDPRNTQVLISSSNDYCGVYAGSPSGGPYVPAGPIWLGYYRSENGGASFQSSLVPGYPGDTSPYAALAHVRTASAGDPVIAWDNHGRVFMGSESSDDPAGSLKTFGDVWVARFDNPGGEGGPPQNDGKRYLGSEIVARGSSAPNLLGKFNDKTAIEADRTGGRCDANVYFSWSRFTGNGGVGIYFGRSTDHGASWSQPMKVSAGVHDVQFPDIAVTGNGNVYITFRQFAAQGQQQDAILYVKSTDCGRTFAAPRQVTTFIPYDAQDASAAEEEPAQSAPDDPRFEEEGSAPGSLARDCGDFQNHCQAGYTFFRRDTQVRSTADQLDTAHEWVYLVYDPTKPGTETATGTTYGSISPGTGSQSAIYFVRLNGATGQTTTPTLIDNQGTGHQLFPDISADGGVLHAVWWDSRNDPAYSPARPVGNDASGKTYPSLDVWAARSTDYGATWTGQTRVTDVTSNPNYEQFDNRTVPFAGDYLWVTSQGNFAYGVWTDWRNTVQGSDPRETTEDEDAGSADVKQCRTYNTSSGQWSGDQCPHDGGLDQNIYGDTTP